MILGVIFLFWHFLEGISSRPQELGGLRGDAHLTCFLHLSGEQPPAPVPRPRPEQPVAITSSSLSRASLSFRCRSSASSQTCCQRAESWFIRGFFVSDWEIMGMLGGAA